MLRELQHLHLKKLFLSLRTRKMKEGAGKTIRTFRLSA
jgi:hypothetical protein